MFGGISLGTVSTFDAAAVDGADLTTLRNTGADAGGGGASGVVIHRLVGNDSV